MKELMEFLNNHPQTWDERREQLTDEGRMGTFSTGKFPRFLQLIEVKDEAIFWEAKKIVDVRLAISEERYPDKPGYAFMYWTGECLDASEFWGVREHLDGAPWHECDAWCAKHQLRAFVARGWRV